MENGKRLLVIILVWMFSISSGISEEISELQGTFRQKLFKKNGPCEREQFRCLNNKCVSSRLYCNGINDCGDNSDEDYCGRYTNRNCPTFYPFYRCNNGYKCIPQDWKCNGVKHCPYGDDELNCDSTSMKFQEIIRAKKSAISWILSQTKNGTTTERWGSHVTRIAVALYLADSSLLSHDNATGRELAYELSIQLLSRFALKKLGDISTSELAHYLNALTVSCVNPKKFYVVDLVAELRSRVDKENYTNPYVMLALCNAGEKITEKDVKKINSAFWGTHSEFWTDTQALAVMALACAASQPHCSFDLSKIKDYTIEIKKRQVMNGTVENLKTTALVMQALFAAETEDDENNFDEEKAVNQILRSQKPDGSFGSVVDTYYALPVLSYRSLVNISSSHCQFPHEDEDSGLKDLVNQIGPKWRIQFSLWIGDEMDIERTLKLRVPANISFYEIMEWASKLDSKYRAKYNVKNGKPFVYYISGIQDDPENGQFWFPYVLHGKDRTLITKSPADYIPEENAHLVFWYRRGSWNK